MPTNRPVSSIVKVDELHDIIGDVESIRGRQDSVDSLLNQMKNENEALWREVAILRQKHMKQQQVVEKLLNFLVSIVRNGVIPAGIKRKQAPLLIDSGGKSVGSNLKLMKTSSSSSTADNIRYSHSPMAQGPIIHDITELDDALNDGTLDLNFGEGNSGENNAQQQQQQQTQEQQPQYSSSSAVIVNSPMSFLSDHSAKANEANQQLVPAADNSIVAIGDIPDSLFDYNLNDDQADVSSLNSILNTPCISINDSPFNINNIGDTSGVDGTGDNNTNTTTTINPCDNNTAGSSNDTNTNNTYVANPTTDLALTKPTSNTLLFDSNEPLSSEYLFSFAKEECFTDDCNILSSQHSSVFNDHLDGIDTELGWLQDQLYDNDFQLDPAKLLEVSILSLGKVMCLIIAPGPMIFTSQANMHTHTRLIYHAEEWAQSIVDGMILDDEDDDGHIMLVLANLPSMISDHCVVICQAHCVCFLFA